jgi:hypothetical protein
MLSVSPGRKVVFIGTGPALCQVPAKGPGEELPQAAKTMTRSAVVMMRNMGFPPSVVLGFR